MSSEGISKVATLITRIKHKIVMRVLLQHFLMAIERFQEGVAILVVIDSIV